MPSCFICHKEIGSVKDGTLLFVREVSPVKEGDYVCDLCARKEVLRVKKDQYRMLVQEFSEKVSKTPFDFEGLDSEAVAENFFVQHRSNQQEMIFFLKKVISRIGDKAGDSCYEDVRNQWAMNWCQQVSKIDV
jgi:hypothetical protein